MSLMSRLKKGMTIWKGQGVDQPLPAATCFRDLTCIAGETSWAQLAGLSFGLRMHGVQVT